MRNPLILTALPTCLVWLAASSASAQPAPRNPQPCDDPTGAYPCDYQIQKYNLQPSPQVFKFQARVSQAKLPVGEAVFNRVIVNVQRGETKLCTEEFTNVQVVDSVVNLEIGRNMSCELDQVIAENPDLSFVLCLGGAANCLRPIQLGSTPYAIKATFARSAQEAHVADIAGQANYAHRTTADRDLYLNKELGYGYFDFATPADRGLLYSTEATWSPYVQGGFIQWAPLSEPNPTLHICSRDDATGQVRPLERLVLASRLTQTTGGVQVDSGGIQVTGPSTIRGQTTVTGQLRVSAPSDANAARGLDVEGDTTLRGAATINSATTVNGRLTVSGGDVTVGRLFATQVVVSDTFQARSQTFETPPNFSSVQGDFLIPGALTVRTGAEVTGGVTVKDGVLNLRQGTNAVTPVLGRDGNKLVLNAASGTTPSLSGGTQAVGDLTATGAFSVAGAATVGGTLRTNSHATVGSSSAEWVQIGRSTAFAGGGRAIQFVRDAADDSYSGEIAFRPGHSSGALSLVGAGTNLARLVKVWDVLDVQVGYNVGAKRMANADGNTLVINPSGAFAAGTRSEGILHVRHSPTTWTTPGAGAGLTLSNLSDGESAHAAMLLRTNSSTGGDPFISMDISNEYGWSFGVDNTDNRFKLYNSWNFPSASNPALSVDTNGALTVRDSVTIGADGKSIRFARDTGDEPNAGVIGYKMFDTGALAIVGAGAGSSRKITMWDNVQIQGNLVVGGELPWRGCPSGMTAYDNGRVRTCIGRTTGGNVNWIQAGDRCRDSFQGASLCSHYDVTRACRLGMSITTVTWMSDRCGDDCAIYTNYTGTSCDNFDGQSNPVSGRAEGYCCLNYTK